ncbi:hypothetical protein [Sporomusa aerivorans]|uniref:hypothetical protein n=1 Tax=Sporomusa aerivorans TaxID=204936 RepID=UPI00352B19C5
MINIAEIINDPDFCQAFSVFRKTGKTGKWVEGEYIQAEQEIKMRGVVVAANTKDLLQVPEGDRVKGVMAFYSTAPLLVTNEAGTSDQVVWHGERYRLFQLWPYVDYGYYKALGERMAGN